MPKIYNPRAISPPFSKYAHGVEATAGARLLFVSGQAGVRPDGTLPMDEKEQHDLAWRNVLAVLADAGMTHEDLLEVTVYITTRSGVPLYRAARDAALKGHLCASTLVLVAGLAHPDWKVEISATAGKS